MCEWFGHNVRCHNTVFRVMCEWSGHNVRVNMECASDWLCVSRNVRVVRS